MNYDVIFIGGGHATWHGAIALARAGKKIAIIEKESVGGTCTNYGCDAKILLDGPFQLTEQLAAYKGLGVNQTPSINWEELMAYKHQVIDALAPGMEMMFRQANVELISGHAKITGEHEVSVGENKYSSETIVIGTGQRAATLEIPGKEFIHDSRDFLRLDTMPERLTFIGAGIIALEFVSMAAHLGKEVHVIEFADQALSMFNQTYVERVINKLEDAGVQFHFGVAVDAVSQNGTAFEVKTNKGFTIETDYVLGATGRVSNVENLGLEALGIKTDRSGIVVDEYLRTNVPSIYASGDVVSKTIPKLTPTATFESNYIAARLLGLNPHPIIYPVVPSVVYTLPRIAEVGVTVKDAQAQPEAYRIQVIPFGKMLAFEYKNELSAEATFIFNQLGHLVGASIYGNEAEELINLLPLIINQKMTAKEFRQQIFAFPGATSGLMDLLNLAFLG